MEGFEIRRPEVLTKELFDVVIGHNGLSYYAGYRDERKGIEPPFIFGVPCHVALQWYLYMVRCREGTLYTGIATNVARRFAEHQDNSTKAAKYLRGRGPLELVFEKAVGTNKGVALSVERQIKHLPKPRKEAILIQADIIDRMVVRAELQLA